jgi:hypothetical protein
MVPTLPYEIHMTVAEGQAELFTETCRQLGVKPLLIVAQLKAEDEETLNNLQTSSIIKGSWFDVRQEMDRIRHGLEKAGFTVSREKVETSPCHPDAPSVERNKLDMPLGCYYECHIPVIMEARGDYIPRYGELKEITERHQVHLSRNAFKEQENGQQLIFMITCRDADMTLEAFTWAKEKLEDELYREGFDTDSDSFAQIEFACFDSDQSQDDKWLHKGPPLNFNIKPSRYGFNDHIGSGTSDLG